MYTVVYTVYRLEGMDRQRFIHYWIDEHAPIAARIPGVRQLEILPVTDAEEGLGDGIDGFVVLRFDSREDFALSQSTPEWARSIEDTRLFARHLTRHVVDSYERRLAPAPVVEPER
jgi:uncharacterized protein (TIGR02118 family)